MITTRARYNKEGLPAADRKDPPGGWKRVPAVVEQFRGMGGREWVTGPGGSGPRAAQWDAQPSSVATGASPVGLVE